MDEDGSGIELEELAQPLIALGLATDTDFVKKALKVLNPNKFGQGIFEDALTLKEFSRIFRTDPVSDKLNFLIKQALDREEELLKKQQDVQNFAQSPDEKPRAFRNSTADSEKKIDTPATHIDA